MVERLRPRADGIIRNCEDLPSNITYRELIELVGGKAAGLLWIQRHIPEIPQARMIVAPPGTSSQEIVRAAQAEGLRLPWIIRASTPVDNIPGFENAFLTLDHQGSGGQIGSDIIKSIEFVKRSGIRKTPLPIMFSETAVIVAEKSTSGITGTLIAHPHRQDIKLAGVSKTRPGIDPRGFYFINENKAEHWARWSIFYEGEDRPEIPNDLETIAGWYEQIATLPGFNPQMTYQLEFGLEPL